MSARRGAVLVMALCAAYGVLSVATRPLSPFTSPDSSVYIDASPSVPVGYPLFLDAFGVSGAAVVQPLLFAASLAFLGIELIALTGSAWLAVAVMTAIVLTPDMHAYQASILTESLFVSGLVAFLAAMSHFVRAPNWRAALAAASIAAATATIRRTAVAFIPVVVLMIVCRWRNLSARGVVAVAALAPFVVMAAADLVAARSLHGDASTSLAGRHLFAKAALIDAPEAVTVSSDARQAALDRELENTYAPIRRLIAAAPDDIRASLVLYYETCLQGPCVSALRESISLPEAAMNEHLAAAGAARIRRAPWNFIALTMTHYTSFWTVFKLHHPDTAPVLTRFLAAHRPLPFEREAFKVKPVDPIEFTPWPVVRWLQPLFLVVAVFTLGAAAIGVTSALRGGVSPAMLAAALASLTAHAGLLFSAAAAAGISRFMVALFPAVVVATALGVWSLVGNRLGRAPSSRYH